MICCTLNPDVFERSDFIYYNFTMSSSKLRVVIDPGHGGETSGAVGLSGVLEKDINLRLSKILKEFLCKKFEVYLTREEDISMSLEDRILFAMEKSADIFLSIHFNADSLMNTNVNRTEIYYPFEETGPSKDLADELYRAFRAKFDIPCHVPMPSRYTVLGSNIPARVLLEVSYLTNSDEKDRLKKEKRLEHIAKIIKGALQSFSSKKMCAYNGFEIREDEIRFNFSKPLLKEKVYVRVDGTNYNKYYVKKKTVVLCKNLIRSGRRLIEVYGRTLDDTGIPHIKEYVELDPKAEYFVASINPYTGFQLIKIKAFDKNLIPIPEGIRMSIEKLDASVRAVRRGIYKPEELETVLKAKREISDEEGTFCILLEGLKDDIQIHFNIGDLNGRLSVENIPRRKSNIVGFVFDEVTKHPLKGVLVSGETSCDYSEEFGIFELERPSDVEKEKVSFSFDGYYPLSKELVSGKPESVYLTPVYNGIFRNVRVFIDIDNRDVLDGISTRRSWLIGEYLSGLVKFAGGIPIRTRAYPWAEIDDYAKVKRALSEQVNFAIQISNSKMNVPDDFYIFFYERSEESRKFAQKTRESVGFSNEPEPKVLPFGNYFVIQLSGPRLVVNSKGIFESELFGERDAAKYIALKLFLGMLSYLGFSGVYFREYDFTENFVNREVVSEDFPISVLVNRRIILHFTRPDSKIVVRKDGVVEHILSKPVEGTCINLPDGS